MRNEDKPRFAAAISMLAATLNNPTSAPMLEGYWQGLKSLELEDLEAAVQFALGEAERMPTPKQLKRFATKAWADRTGHYFLEGTGWIQDPYSPAAQLQRRLEARERARTLASWPEEGDTVFFQGDQDDRGEPDPEAARAYLASLGIKEPRH